jgi:hypothetical protein
MLSRANKLRLGGTAPFAYTRFSDQERIRLPGVFSKVLFLILPRKALHIYEN